MGIKSSYNKSAFDASLTKDISKLKEAAGRLFLTLGSRAVDLAYSDGNYINRTGTLRSSIGCGVSIDGVVKSTYGFFPFGIDSTGIQEGKDFLNDLLKENSRKDEIRLVVVAGAEHASFVENLSEYVVLESSEEFIVNSIDSILLQLKVF